MNDRRELEELLPAYVNGSLDAATASAVATAVAEDPALADEVRFLAALRDHLQAADTGTAPGAMGWQRLRRSLDRQPQTMAWSRLWRPAAAVAAALVIAIQAGLLWQAQAPTEPAYVPLAAATAGQIQIRFAPTATAAEIRNLLAAVGLDIVSGPGAAGVYRLRLVGDAGEADITAAITYLRDHGAIVAHVARQ